MTEEITPCPDRPHCLPCPHPPIPKNESGPDVPGIECHVPDGCCFPPCGIDLDTFICKVRELLPEGEIYNTTNPAYRDPPENRGASTVGCAKIGCEQIILGGCCDDSVLCDDEPISPQLAVVDAFAAVMHGALENICKVISELDPCTANLLLHDYAKRSGLITDSLCDSLSEEAVAFILCIAPLLRTTVLNMEALEEIALMFGSEVKIFTAGDFSSCAPTGWWTMAIENCPTCGQRKTCPDDAPLGPNEHIAAFHAGELTDKITLTESLNIVLCPADRKFRYNCNLPRSTELPHDPGIYKAFKEWLLPRMLPKYAYWCIYDCSEPCLEHVFDKN